MPDGNHSTKLRTKTVFVTVGTTCFEELTGAVCDIKVLELLSQLGFNKIIMQIGNGKFQPDPNLFETFNIELEVFTLKPSIAEYFADADLVVSHAGAGCCLEALEAGKHLIAVVNERLMHNHQRELAQAFADEGFSLWCTPQILYETIKLLPQAKFKPYLPGNPKLFATFLDGLMLSNIS